MCARRSGSEWHPAFLALCLPGKASSAREVEVGVRGGPRIIDSCLEGRQKPHQGRVSFLFLVYPQVIHSLLQTLPLFTLAGKVAFPL